MPDSTAAASPTWATSLSSQRPLLGDHLDIPPGTFIDIIRAALSAHPDRVQYVLADGTEYTLQQFHDVAASFARALLALDVSPMSAVAILGANSLPWFAADVGTSLAAAIPVGIYTTSAPDVVAYIVNHSAAEVFLADSMPAVNKFLAVRDRCPHVRRVVCWGDDFDAAEYAPYGTDFVVSWDAFLASGATEELDEKARLDDEVQRRMDLATPQTICKLIYTSGTTGPPKAVMLSHDNVFFTAVIVSRNLKTSAADRIVSFLPASHIAANSIDIIGALYNGSCVTFAPADALRGSLVTSLRAVRPTVLFAVPRVFEKIMERMLSAGAEAGTVKKLVAGWAKGVGSAAAVARDRAGDASVAAPDEGMPWGYRVADAVVFANVKKTLGLDQCRLIINAAAPLQAATDEYFRSLDFQIVDLYGMSEATGPLTVNYPKYRRGTSGRVFPGIELRLHNQLENGEGELCFRGRNMFVGYLNDADETRQTMDEAGFVHTGDLGTVDADGFVTITGRVKDLLITAGGENVAPALVESTLVSAMPAVARAFALGDRRKFIAAVVIPLMDEDGNLVGPAANVNPDVTTGAMASKDGTWKKYVTEGVARANQNAISNAAKVKAFEILPKDFSVEGGELTPKMSVKRKVVVEKLEPVIARIYGE